MTPELPREIDTLDERLRALEDAELAARLAAENPLLYPRPLVLEPAPFVRGRRYGSIVLGIAVAVSLVASALLGPPLIRRAKPAPPAVLTRVEPVKPPRAAACPARGACSRSRTWRTRTRDARRRACSTGARSSGAGRDPVALSPQACRRAGANAAGRRRLTRASPGRTRARPAAKSPSRRAGVRQGGQARCGRCRRRGSPPKRARR